jgi:hypothetical protein
MQTRGLLQYTVDKRGCVSIELGKAMDAFGAANRDIQWIFPIRNEIEKQAKAFIEAQQHKKV